MEFGFYRPIYLTGKTGRFTGMSKLLVWNGRGPNDQQYKLVKAHCCISSADLPA